MKEPNEKLYAVDKSNENRQTRNKNSINYGVRQMDSMPQKYMKVDLPFDEESVMLNQLIHDYRKDNERCSDRIMELQSKLKKTSDR